MAGNAKPDDQQCIRGQIMMAQHVENVDVAMLREFYGLEGAPA